ncbi:hypothetical protein SN15_01965 [Stenotrophomonas maltophilia]|nr:hypothetical protein SN15_01965 [Stenotrophomonas maltophilia]
MDKPTDSEIIDRLGGTTEVARICQIRPPSVSEWRATGIPSARRQFLELLRPEVFAPGYAAPGAESASEESEVPRAA